MKREHLETVQFAVDKARKAGAAAEAWIADTESVQVTVNQKAVEQLNIVREAGIGVRVLREGKMAFGSTNDLSRESLRQMVDGLVKKAGYHSVDENHLIPGKAEGIALESQGAWTELTAYDPTIADKPVQQKIAAAQRMEAAGLAFSPKVTGSMMTIYQDASTTNYLANSNGLSGWFRQSGCGGAVEFTAADGEARESGSFQKSCTRWDDFNPEEVGRKGAEAAVSMLGAKSVASVELPMVIAPEIGTQILTFVVGMLSAEAVQKGRSLFSGKEGQKVAAAGFTLIDDGRLKGGVSSTPVDGEGVATQTTPLIVDGELKTFLYDCYCARRGKTRSTGNRVRSGFGSAGGVGPTNLYLKPGGLTAEAIFAGVDRGFYLTVVLGLFAAVDPASGDFSIPSAGFMIENGKKSYPVRGVSISGNLFDLLKHVDRIGSDLTWFNTVGSPTFSVQAVKIGGAAT